MKYLCNLLLRSVAAFQLLLRNVTFLTTSTILTYGKPIGKAVVASRGNSKRTSKPWFHKDDTKYGRSPVYQQVHDAMHKLLPKYLIPHRQGTSEWYPICDPTKVAHVNKVLSDYYKGYIERGEELYMLDSLARYLKEKKGEVEILDWLQQDVLPAVIPDDPYVQGEWERFKEEHCDFYGPGGGMCIMQAHRRLEPEKRERQKILLNSNCQIWKPGEEDGMLHQLFHCPQGVPVAFFMLPKSGTTSSLNYILDHEPYTDETMGRAMDAMLTSPSVMIKWLASELDRWGYMHDNKVVQDLSQRLMHRFPGDAETQQNWKWMRFLPPAHLCPLCCVKQKWRKKVILGRNPFVRIASFYQFAWIPEAGYNNKSMENDSRTSRSTRFGGWSKFSPWLHYALGIRQQLLDSGLRGFTRGTEQMGDKDKYLFCSNETLTQDVLDQFDQRASVYTGGDPKDLIPTKLSAEQETRIQNQEKLSQTGFSIQKFEHGKAGYCVNLESELDVSDVFHFRPFEDMLNDEVFLEVNGELSQEELDDFFILHLETLPQDIRELYDVLCRDYGYCEDVPEAFPHVMPCVNEARKTCVFDPVSNKYLNCPVTWEELWTPENIALVQKHYAFDLNFFGYSDTPDYAMPLKWM